MLGALRCGSSGALCTGNWHFSLLGTPTPAAEEFRLSLKSASISFERFIQTQKMPPRICGFIESRSLSSELSADFGAPPKTAPRQLATGGHLGAQGTSLGPPAGLRMQLEG
eukprot:1154559-Pelagomonas_calceolata.AAC.3